MAEDPGFTDLIRRVRGGEEAAAAELVRTYEPEIRRAVRIRLTDPRLGRLLDSMDICQSVLANFFIRAAAGQFDLKRPEQLLKLLVTMARNKLRDQARRQRAERRDHRRVEYGRTAALEAVADGAASPSRVVAGQELLQEMRRQLSAEERYLADQRGLGREWADIAAERGEHPDALRKRLARAVDRVARQLGLEEVGDE
jgi:DNA-directed RNA polymerase specialized sigma24 family protein